MRPIAQGPEIGGMGQTLDKQVSGQRASQFEFVLTHKRIFVEERFSR